MKRIFVEENVKFRTEITQALLDFIEHQLDATCAECLNSFFFGKSDRIGLPCCDSIFTYLCSDIGNVLAAVAIFGCLMSHRTRIERASETIDLRTVIIEVVLAGHLRARCLHQARKGISHGRPACTTQVNRTCGVGGDILQVNVQPLHGFTTAESSTGLDNGAGKLACRGSGKTNIDEAWTSDFCAINALEFIEVIDEDLCKVARVHSRLLCQLHGNIAGPVAMIAVTRPLDLHRLGKVCGLESQVALLDLSEQKVVDMRCKFFWSHHLRVIVSIAPMPH